MQKGIGARLVGCSEVTYCTVLAIFELYRRKPRSQRYPQTPRPYTSGGIDETPTHHGLVDSSVPLFKMEQEDNRGQVARGSRNVRYSYTNTSNMIKSLIVKSVDCKLANTVSVSVVCINGQGLVKRGIPASTTFAWCTRDFLSSL